MSHRFQFVSAWLTALMLGCCLLAAPALAQQCPATVWADEFSGTALDQNKWSYQIGDGCSIGLCGWGNNELQYYKQENVTVGGGTLKITAKKERVQGKQYTSGRIRTINKGEWSYGRFEAVMKITQGKGIWPAFWMLPTDEVYGGWPQSGEIDIMENVGHEKRTVHGTIHYGPAYPNNKSTGSSFTRHASQSIFADGFHKFAIEKEAGVIRWFVDDILYLTKTSADLSPDNWPFNERFHYLLNVAVGGNWPGSPDATTVFPQTLEVDYVRVYDGYFPYITGKRTVSNRESSVTYSVGQVPGGTSVTWSVPAGATIASGQGTSSVTVNWGNTSGDVVASFSTSCNGAQQLKINVEVEPPYGYDFSFENFDFPANVTLNTTRTTGTLAKVSNPSASGVNTSPLVGRYTRNAAEQYDVLFYSTTAIPDASLYKTKQRKFFIDVYTDAPVGSTVLLQLENSAQATATNYPTGRHSRYQGVTTVRNQWQRIELPLLDTPDPGTSNTAIDNIVILFAPNTTTGHVYHFDNLDSYLQTAVGAPASPTGLTAAAASSTQINLTWTDASSDETGFKVERSTNGTSFAQIATVGANATSYASTGLSASTTYYYRVRAYNGTGNSGYSRTAAATTQGGGGGGATTMHVAALTTGTQASGGGNKKGTATVTVHDNLGNPVSGATVTGSFTGDFNESASGVTASNGTVTLVTSGQKKGTISFTFCVDNVTHTSLSYNASANVATCSGGAGKTSEAGVPEVFALGQNYPNPFNPSTVITYALPEAAPVRLTVYDALGKEVRVLVDGVREAGTHDVTFEAQTLPTGVYVYMLQAGAERLTRAMLLVR